MILYHIYYNQLQWEGATRRKAREDNKKKRGEKKRKRKKITSVEQDVEKLIRALYTVGRKINWCNKYGNQCGSSQKIKNKTTP